MALQPDGTIVVAVSELSGHFVVYRYLSDGTTDESFGINGRVSTDFGLSIKRER